MSQSKGVMAYERPDCAQVFFMFAGLGEMLMMNPIKFLQTTKLSNRNIVLFKDSHGANYEKGVSEEIVDFDGLVDFQREFVASRPHIRDVFIVGTSAGGAAALRCGHELNAEKVWSFGTRVPQVSLIPYLREQMGVLLSAKTQQEARQIFRDMPDDWRNEFFAARETPERVIDNLSLDNLIATLADSNGVTDYSAYYCDRSPVDTFVADRLRDVPNMNVVRIEMPTNIDLPEFDTGHNVLRPMQHSGLLAELFPAFVAA